MGAGRCRWSGPVRKAGRGGPLWCGDKVWPLALGWDWLRGLLGVIGEFARGFVCWRFVFVCWRFLGTCFRVGLFALPLSGAGLARLFGAVGRLEGGRGKPFDARALFCELAFM